MYIIFTTFICSCIFIILWNGLAIWTWHLIIISKWTHWGRVTYICVSNLTIIGSDNGLMPGRRQAIIWTNDGILLIALLGTNFEEFFNQNTYIWFKKIHLKMSSGKCRPFCLGLNVLKGGKLPDYVNHAYCYDLAVKPWFKLCQQSCCYNNHAKTCTITLGQSENLGHRIQCGAVIMWLIFSKILTVDTPLLTREGEVWDVCCDSDICFTFCHCYRSVVYNIVIG